jgi:uncharacterized protein YlxW (UPF0749 family)
VRVGVWPLAAGAVLVVAGALFAASAVASGGSDLRAERASEIRDVIAAQAAAVADREQRVADLQAQVNALTTGAAGDPAVAQQRARIAGVAQNAGATEVTGAGVQVTLDDAPPLADDDPLAGDVSPDDLVVHQSDVEAVVNALWRGGATAMQIMDQRIVSTSAVRCVGNTLILEGRVYSPPFVITAVGDPDRLGDELAADPGVELYRAWADLVGLGYDVVTLEQVTVPPFTGSVTMNYATPVGTAVETATAG